MGVEKRRKKIEQILSKATDAVSASALSERLEVSRQIIVGDIALLRAGGSEILSTPKGYVIDNRNKSAGVLFTIACSHNSSLAKEELYNIVDNGGKLLDVIVEHSLYGQITGQLNIASRFDADNFLDKVEKSNASLLSDLTDGIHLHTISCPDTDCETRIKAALAASCILLEE